MTSTVTCPDCRRPATVISRFTVDEHAGSAEYLRIRCTGSLTLLIDAEKAIPPAPAPPPFAVE